MRTRNLVGGGMEAAVRLPAFDIDARSDNGARNKTDQRAAWGRQMGDVTRSLRVLAGIADHQRRTLDQTERGALTTAAAGIRERQRWPVPRV